MIVNVEHRTREELNAFYDGVREGVRLWAWWKDGEEYVGTTGTKLIEARQLIEDMRQVALKKFE